MRIYLLCIYLGVLGFGTHYSRAQVFDDQYFRKKAYVGIAYTYNMEFERAHDIFRALRYEYSDHPAPHFLMSLNRWWETYVASGMKKYHEFIANHLDTAIVLNEALADLPNYKLEYHFFQYMNYAFKARYHTLRKEWWKAAMAGKNAFPYLKKGFDFREESPEFYFGSGIYHYYAEDYPQTHPIIQPLMIFFPKGSISLGIEELSVAASTPNFAQFEAMFYLGDIYLKQEKFRLGFELYQTLSKKFPENTWFQMEYGRALYTYGMSTEAYEVLKPMMHRYENIPGHKARNIITSESRYTTYLMSRTYLWAGLALMEKDLSLSHKILKKAELMAQLASLDKDDEYLPAISYALGITYDRLKQREKAKENYRKVLTYSQNHPYKDRAQNCLKETCNQIDIPILGEF